MIYIIFYTVVIILLGVINGFYAKQLEYNKPTNKNKNKYYKGLWHILNGVLFVTLWLFGLFLIPDKSYFDVIFLLVSIQLLLYDNIIDITRGRFSWKFQGTCEGKWDTDCIALAVDEGIGLVNIIRIVVFVIAVINYWR